jgi:FkbM family methyltransferase
MQPDLIYDVGMNNGDDTAHFLNCGYRVIAIEADPRLADHAKNRFSDALTEGKLTILNVGIDVAEGLRPFWICDDNDEWSSFDPSLASRQHCRSHAVSVQCRRFRSILVEYGVPYYLKVDIEGRDHLCVADLDPADLPLFVSLELFFLEDLLLLRDIGYNAFKCIDQVDHRQLAFEMPDAKTWLKYKLKDKPTLYRACEAMMSARHSLLRPRWRRSGGAAAAFPLGSSGPFADATDGTWQTWQQVAHSWLSFHLGFGNRRVKGWQDLHATRLETPPFNIKPSLTRV